MCIEEILVLLISILIAAAVICVYRLITKKFFEGLNWFFPLTFPLGFIIMYLTTDQDLFWIMLKEMLLWSFILIMIPISFKSLVFGRKNNKARRAKLWSETKEAFQGVKPLWQSKKQKKQECIEDEDQTQEGESDDGV